MKVAICEPANQAMKLGPKPVPRYEVWVNDDAVFNEVFHAPMIGMVKVIGFNGVTDKPETELVDAEDLQVGNEIYFHDEWRTVLSTYVHPKSCYQKPHLSQSDSSLPLSVRIGRHTQVKRKTRESVMSIALLTSHELVKSLQAKLADFQALNDAPPRVEIVPTVFVDKAPIMAALKTDIKAEYAKLGEQLKKL